MTTVTISWIPVSEQLPDAESNVLLFATGEEAGSFEGFYDGEDRRGPIFRDVTALQVEGVTHWAEMPKGPREIAELTAKVASLERHLAEAPRDAERYRWLRSRVPGGTYRIMGVIYSEGGAGVDAAIDAAMPPAA